MKIKQTITAFVLFTLLSCSLLKAQGNYISVSFKSTGCTKEAIEELLKAVNQYRADSKNWNSNVVQPEFTLGGVTDEQRGLLQLPTNKDLMHSSHETARKFADGTYPIWDHIVKGEGPTMRAIKDGWIPSMNKIFYANEEPVFTMTAENLFSGSLGYTWQDVFEAWKNSPGHNTTLLSRGAVSMGCGCSDTKDNQETYWVLLVEVENSMTETDDIMNKYFTEGVFYKKKDKVKRSELSKIKAIDGFEFIDSGLQQIKNEK